MSHSGAPGQPPPLDPRRIRSIMETPILDARKWAKVPGIPADCFIVDLEDSVVPSRKVEARERAMESLGDLAFFGGRPVIARPNNIATPWGRDDIAAFAGAGVALMAYPKARDVEEVEAVVGLLAEHGAQPRLFPIIETANALLDVQRIARLPLVAGLFTGIGDLSVDAGMAFYGADGEINGPLQHARTMVALASAAYRRSATDTLFVKDVHDDDAVRAAIDRARRCGFTSLATFYPPHVERINELLPPQGREIEEALDVVTRYAEAQRAGNPAVLLPGGRFILALDDARARALLVRAGIDVPEPTTEVVR